MYRSRIYQELRWRYALALWIGIKEIMWYIATGLAVLAGLLIFFVPFIGYLASHV